MEKGSLTRQHSFTLFACTALYRHAESTLASSEGYVSAGALHHAPAHHECLKHRGTKERAHRQCQQAVLGLEPTSAGIKHELCTMRQLG